MGQIYDDVMSIFNGQTPIKRQNPRPGESAYYCVNPGQNLNTSTFTNLQTTDMQDNQPLFNTGQGLNQNQQVQTEKNNFQMPQSNWNNVVMGAITGTGEGWVGGLERIANNATVGLYGDYISAGYQDRQNKAQQQAEQAGLGEAYKWGTRAIDYGLGSVHGTLLKKVRDILRK